MKTASTISALAFLASASHATAAKSGTFKLTASATGHAYNPSFNGNLLSSFHTGAGESTIVTTPNPSQAATFYVEDGALIYNSSYPFVFSLVDSAPYLSDAPEGYKIVSLRVGTPDQGTTPFEYDTSGEVSLSRYDFTFALCNVNGTSPYPTLGPQTQLLWRQPSRSIGDIRSPRRCADVVLHAVQILV